MLYLFCNVIVLYFIMGAQQTASIGVFRIELSNKAFLSGEPIKGKIIADIISPTTLEDISYRLTGSEFAEVYKFSLDNILSDLVAAHKRIESRCTYNICNDKSNIPYHCKELTKGHYEIEFSVPTRSSFPSTYFDKSYSYYCSISYNLCITANLVGNQHIDIDVPVNLTQKYPSESISLRNKFNLRNFMLFKKGEVKTQIAYNSNNVSPDQLVMGQIHIKSPKLYKPQRVSLYINRTIKIKLGRFSTRSWESSAFIQNIELKNSIGDFLLPFPHQMALKSCTGNVVSNIYEIYIKIDYPWKFMITQKCPIYLTDLGSVPAHWEPPADFQIPDEEIHETKKPEIAKRYVPSCYIMAKSMYYDLI